MLRHFVGLVAIGLLVDDALAASTCTTPTGNGTCIATSSCGGTSVAGYCPGTADNIQCCVRTCSTPKGFGFCEKTSSGCSGGSFLPGYCPGSVDTQCCVASCSTDTGRGYCEWTGSSCLGGSFISGACPGPSDVKCCVSPCTTPQGSGNCEYYSSSGCSGGSFIPGHCPGGSNYQCCVKGSSQGTGTGLPGLDISEKPPSSFWACAASTYKVVVIRGYIQGCSIGGEVDPNFVASYHAAVAAGIQRIDSYMFPCTGTQLPTDHACKDPATQLAEYFAVIDSNNMRLNTLWLDIEQTDATNGPDECNAWNLGGTKNQALAQQWVALMQSSGRKWGIYANGNNWADIFSSRSTDIGSQLPLWAVQEDYVPGVDTVHTFMGGWTNASGKQYNLDTTACGGGVDLDSFL